MLNLMKLLYLFNAALYNKGYVSKGCSINTFRLLIRP